MWLLQGTQTYALNASLANNISAAIYTANRRDGIAVLFLCSGSFTISREQTSTWSGISRPNSHTLWPAVHNASWPTDSRMYVCEVQNTVQYYTSLGVRVLASPVILVHISGCVYIYQKRNHSRSPLLSCQAHVKSPSLLFVLCHQQDGHHWYGPRKKDDDVTVFVKRPPAFEKLLCGAWRITWREV